MDQAGNLYGTTYSGGENNWGTVYQLLPPDGTHTKWRHGVIHSFCGTFCTPPDGIEPMAPLVIDKAGNLYGTASDGTFTPYSWGSVFELKPNAKHTRWTIHTITTFCLVGTCQDGSHPHAGLAYLGQANGVPYDGTSPLFGTTSDGGDSGAGVLFELSRKSGAWGESVIYSFCSQPMCDDGSNPSQGSLAVDDQYNIFGALPQGGSRQNNAGVALKFTPVKRLKWSETVTYNFCSVDNCADGFQPYGGVTLDGAGNVYGTTGYGGGCSNDIWANCGTVFRISTDGTETLLHIFCSWSQCSDGYDPRAAPIMDGSGTLYGTTIAGGASGEGGTVYAIRDGNFSVLHNFCSKSACADGNFADSPLIMDNNGNLYGTTSGGGKNDGGVVFEITP